MQIKIWMKYAMVQVLIELFSLNTNQTRTLVWEQKKNTFRLRIHHIDELQLGEKEKCSQFRELFTFQMKNHQFFFCSFEIF